jgi:hypothetical protein
MGAVSFCPRSIMTGGESEPACVVWLVDVFFALRRDCFGAGRMSIRSVSPFFFLALA